MEVDRPSSRLAVLGGHLLAEESSTGRPMEPSAVAAAAVPLRGQVVVITGCTSGLGLSLAREFVRLGHLVAGCGRRAEAIAELNAELGAAGGFFHVADTASDESVAAFAREVGQRHGAVDVLIANAGLGPSGKLPWEQASSHIHNIVDVNVKGVMFTNKHFVPLMLKDLDKVPLDAPRRVINMSSGIAHTSMPFTSDYCASKFAVEGYSKCVAQSFKMLPPETRGRILCVPFAPGVVRTEMNTREGFPTAEAWSKDAAPFILQIPESENGSSMVMPGYYSEQYQETWIVPANARMNEKWLLPQP